MPTHAPSVHDSPGRDADDSRYAGGKSVGPIVPARVVELVSMDDGRRSARASFRDRLGPAITERHAVRHHGPARQDAEHRELAAGAVDDRLGQRHEPAALGIDRHAAGDRLPQLGPHRAVGGESRGVDLGKTAAQENARCVRRQLRVVQRAEWDDRRAGGDEGLDVFRIREVERLVLGDGDDRRGR